MFYQNQYSFDLINMPQPLQDELPSNYADRVGTWYTEKISLEHKKKYGTYLTNTTVAKLLSTFPFPKKTSLKILDPAAGSGILVCALLEKLVHQNRNITQIDIVLYEIDSALIKILESVINYLKVWANKSIFVTSTIINNDFIINNSEFLSLQKDFFSETRNDVSFDIVIANPPYFKIAKNDTRARAAQSIVHGQPNIYGLFMAVGAMVLKNGGVFLFIIPRSFCSGPYFTLFRNKFFRFIRPIHIHIFDSRKEAFKRDEVLQENIIFQGIYDKDWHLKTTEREVLVSSSQGISDIENSKKRITLLSDMLDMKSKEKIMRFPLSDKDDNTFRVVDSWQGSLKKYGIEVSTGPVVPFRAKDYIDNNGDVPKTHSPLLWMNNVHAMSITWPNGVRKTQYIKNSAFDRSLLLPNKNYVVIRRFSAKEEVRRLIAAPYLAATYNVDYLGLENHLNYIYKPNGSLSDIEVWGLATLFTSNILDAYFRCHNGNTQVSATEIRNMPLPDYPKIIEIGETSKNMNVLSLEDINNSVERILNIFYSEKGD